MSEMKNTAAPEAVAVDQRWCPDVCPITGRKFFMWITHHDTGDDVPTYGGPFDSYTIPVKNEDGSYSCERYDHDFGGWREWEDVGLTIVDDQSFVVEPDNQRYDEIRDFAEGRAALAATPAAAPAGWKLVPIEPTSEMLESAGAADRDGTPATYKTLYMAMVGASPAAAPVVLPEPFTTLVRKNSWSPSCYEASPRSNSQEYGRQWADERINVHTEQQVRALLAGVSAPAAVAVLDYPWRDRLLDGRELVRDQQGFAEHSELPLLDEGMKPRAFFAALGVEMKHTMADDDLSMDEYDAMSDAENWSAWIPRPPIGDAWNLVAIFDTEDGPAAWWARALKESREASPQAQADARDADSAARFKSQQDFLNWNRAQQTPPVKIAQEYGVFNNAIDLYRAAVAAQAAKGGDC